MAYRLELVLSDYNDKGIAQTANGRGILRLHELQIQFKARSPHSYDALFLEGLKERLAIHGIGYMDELSKLPGNGRVKGPVQTYGNGFERVLFIRTKPLVNGSFSYDLITRIDADHPMYQLSLRTIKSAASLSSQNTH